MELGNRGRDSITDQYALERMDGSGAPEQKCFAAGRIEPVPDRQTPGIRP